MAPSPSPPIFLVVDFQRESRYLLVKTLMRKFPHATIHECEDAGQALQLARSLRLACIVTHRTFETGGIELVRELRDADPQVPIVMVSGRDRERAALKAGATSFLGYEEWLRIGTVVEGHIATTDKKETLDDEAGVA